MGDGRADLVFPGPHDKEVTVVVAGLACVQMQALAAGDVEKVAAAGNSLGKLAKANPERVREAFLQNRDAFRIAAMPDEMLDHLDLKVKDGKLYENTDGGGWTEVEIDE
jgi:hypothetical protein